MRELILVEGDIDPSGQPCSMTTVLVLLQQAASNASLLTNLSCLQRVDDDSVGVAGLGAVRRPQDANPGEI